jgi:hypothetical protein
MFSGLAIIGAIAAIVAASLANRVAQRIEEAVSQVESQVWQVEAEAEASREAQYDAQQEAGLSRSTTNRAHASLRSITIVVHSSATGEALTWLLARLGWHPKADENGLSWVQAAVALHLDVQTRPSAVPEGPGHLSFDAGQPDRISRIARESTRHGFRCLGLESTSQEDWPRELSEAILRAPDGFEVRLQSAAERPAPHLITPRA